MGNTVVMARVHGTPLQPATCAHTFFPRFLLFLLFLLFLSFFDFLLFLSFLLDFLLLLFLLFRRFLSSSLSESESLLLMAALRPRLPDASRYSLTRGRATHTASR